MIAALVGADVAVVETRRAGSPGDLRDEERADLGRASAGRVAEYAAGRRCAHEALAALGVAGGPLRRDRDREPLWPPGVVGSITHCAGYCAAAVAHTTAIRTIGIDAEVHDRLPAGVLGLIALPQEARWIEERAADEICWDRLLFSAKEATFKAWYPLARRWLDFDDAHVVFAADAGTFDVTLLVPGPVVGGIELRGFAGRYLVQDGVVLTAIATTGEPLG